MKTDSVLEDLSRVKDSGIWCFALSPSSNIQNILHIAGFFINTQGDIQNCPHQSC